MTAHAPTYAHVYDRRFYDYIADGATRSAEVVVPIVLQQIALASVLDVGCGAGAWVASYLRHGVHDALGIDGHYVERSSLRIPPGAFQAHDISARLDLGRRFDVVQCLEVAEHLPAAASATLIENLVRHGECVLFSAAVPGQGGEGHVNEQTYEFWRAMFAQHGYAPYDCIRPRLRGARGVERWYAQNLLLYVDHAAARALTAEVAATRVPDGVPIADLSSWSDALRRAVLRRLPCALVSRLAVVKHQWVLATRRRTREAG